MSSPLIIPKNSSKPAGDPSVLYTMEKLQKPENFSTRHKNPTMKMLELIMLNQEQLQVKNYVKRKPKYLFNIQKSVTSNQPEAVIAKRSKR